MIPQHLGCVHVKHTLDLTMLWRNHREITVIVHPQLHPLLIVISVYYCHLSPHPNRHLHHNDKARTTGARIYRALLGGKGLVAPDYIFDSLPLQSFAR